tara:strand:+ start:54 stop:401 length:348 start_codon:yes stop_codon:yes gene_type:complete
MGYRMKGFSGFKSSPAKISDEAVVDAVKSLGATQNKFIEKGFVTAAKQGVTDQIDKKIMGKKYKSKTTDEDKDDAGEGQTYTQGDAALMEKHLNEMARKTDNKVVDEDILKDSGL